MLANKTFADLLAAFGSPDPTPGGGSASALAGALGTSLLAMVAGMPKTKTGTPEARAALDAARVELLQLQGTLVDLADRDAAAYDMVVAAFRLPKATDEDKAARKAAVQRAMRAATEVPLETMRAAVDLARRGVVVATHGNPSAKSDVLVALSLAGTAYSGGRANVEINLEGVTDAGWVENVRAEMQEMTLPYVTSLRDTHLALGFTSHAWPAGPTGSH
jgi:methenyltetrahydrofolate cyclohydrolase